MNCDINTIRKTFDTHFKILTPDPELLPEIGQFLRTNWNSMTSAGRATASISIKHYQVIPERHKIRFRNNWKRFRAFLSRIPELKNIASNQNHPLHNQLIDSGVSVSDERIEDFKAIYDFQNMMVEHTNYFESNNNFHVSFLIFMTDHKKRTDHNI